MVNDGKAKKTPVKTGFNDGSKVEILSGIDAQNHHSGPAASRHAATSRTASRHPSRTASAIEAVPRRSQVPCPAASMMARVSYRPT